MLDKLSLLKDLKPIGARAKFGVIIPPSNTVNEAEFNGVAPEGISFHFTRAPLHSNPAADGFKEMLDDVGKAMNDLVACNVDFATYACTAGSMSCPSELLLNALSNNNQIRSNTTAQAIVAAIQQLGAKKITLASPYTQQTNAHEVSYLESYGIDVLAAAGLDLNTSLKNIQKISRVAPMEVFNHVKKVDQTDAQLILICCTDFNTFDVIDLLELELGKPVISSNSATLWHTLRNFGLNDKLPSLGTLLRDH
tara:strand:+ start:385 stop:1140 length:756 start_codon:yes stop_codon:yes gene_type:complete